MDWNEILHNIIIPLLGIVGVSFLLYAYFTKSKVKIAVDKVLQFLPMVLEFAKSFVKDEKGKFDKYDALELLGRVSAAIKKTVKNPENITFADVEAEVFELVRKELAYYENLPGAPDLKDEAIRVQVKVIFESIQRAMREDTTGNDS